MKHKGFHVKGVSEGSKKEHHKGKGKRKGGKRKSHKR